jgi:mitogen-activated protein kinase organizer 1
VTHISVSNDGKCVLASCLDSRLRLLETDTGELLNAYTGHEATSTRAEGRLSHDDACVLSTSEDGRVIAWDIVQAVMVRQFKVLCRPTFICCARNFLNQKKKLCMQPLNN